MRRYISGFLFMALLATMALYAVLVPMAFGQTETGQITGTVLDPTGAGIPNATVTAKDLSTNAARQVKTPDGNYVFANLLPGRYEVTAAAEGFQTTKQVVSLAVGTRMGLELRLAVGTSTTVVEVSEAAATINTETQS